MSYFEVQNKCEPEYTKSELFSDFVANLALSNSGQISDRYGRITRALNRKYRDSESTTLNSLKVGSMGRFTAIDGISDLDMAYILPNSQWSRFKDGGQSALLQEVKNAIKLVYTNTEIRGDGQVVVVRFKNFVIEVLPCFQLSDGSFKYPDTKSGGTWKITKPRKEIRAVSVMDSACTGNYRRLCKMVRAWKNHVGQAIGGLLIDTVCYRFFEDSTDYKSIGYGNYDQMLLAFFKYLAAIDKDKEFFLAPGSFQRVYIRKKFQRKAKKAAELCEKAIVAEGKTYYPKRWRKILGKAFPVPETKNATVNLSEGVTWSNTEEFIEDLYPVDIRYSASIDCEVTQNGFRTLLLKQMLKLQMHLKARKNLRFWLRSTDTPAPYEVKWKILNRGDEAIKRDCVRGQITKIGHSINETTDFRGNHFVECYIIKNGICVARSKILVPIATNNDDEK